MVGLVEGGQRDNDPGEGQGDLGWTTVFGLDEDGWSKEDSGEEGQWGGMRMAGVDEDAWGG